MLLPTAGGCMRLDIGMFFMSCPGKFCIFSNYRTKFRSKIRPATGGRASRFCSPETVAYRCGTGGCEEGSVDQSGCHSSWYGYLVLRIMYV
jgi:hypothetical protein